MTYRPFYRYIQDPGHGWIEVSYAELVALGIADRISRYSYASFSNYENNPFIYLEEDCDAGLWLKARDATPHPIAYTENIREIHTNLDCWWSGRGSDSFIRNLPSYRPPADLRAATAARLRAAITATPEA